MMENYLIMSENLIAAKVIDGNIHILDDSCVPFYFKRHDDFRGWLRQRAIDDSRVNSRLLKKALRLQQTDDISTALHFNAATITDTYWVKSEDSTLTYEDIKFKSNTFDNLALTGDVNSFNQKPSRTPELTNIGSYEKCWRLEDGAWWLYKVGSIEERFTEMLAYYLALELNIPIAWYEIANGYIRSKDFTDGALVNYEPAASIIGDRASYLDIYDAIQEISPSLADSFVQMVYFDALIFNMDRHSMNYGFLRNVATGEIIGAAPLFDHNIALISRGYPASTARQRDLLIEDFIELLENRDTGFDIPVLTDSMVNRAISRVGVDLERSQELSISPYDFIREFVMNGQNRIVSELSQTNTKTERDEDFER
jgi:hypothetical protein